MNDENNVKYIPELWLENDKDEDLKIAFMTALFNQWNGEGKGFNADMVDGWHLAEILDYVNEKTKDKLSQFYIGQTKFSETSKPAEGKYTLGFDSIKLYNPDSSIVDPIYTSAQKKLPWADEVPDLEEEFEKDSITYTFLDPDSSSPSLYDIFKELYIILNYKLSGKLSKAEFDEYQEEQAPLSEIVKRYKEKGYYQEIEEEGETRYLFNADQLNGVRIFIKTQAQYQALSDEIKENPRNLIFIIDEADLHEDGDVNKPIKYNLENPDTCPISEFYKFKVFDEDPETGESIEPTLYYQHPTSNVWISMGITAKNFIDNGTLSEKVAQVLNSNSNYTINQNVFKNSFKNLTVEPSTDDYPFLTYLKEYYIHGGVYTKANGNVDRAPLTTYNGDGYTYIDLDTPLNVLNTKIQSQIGTINTTLGTHTTQISNVTSTANSASQASTDLLNSLNTLKGGSTATIKNLDDRIGDIELDYITTDDLAWEGYYLGGLEEYLESDHDKYYCYTTRNPSIKMGYIHLNCFHYHDAASNKGKWTNMYTNLKFDNKKIGDIYAFYDKNPNFAGFNRIHQTTTQTPIDLNPKIQSGYHPAHPTIHMIDFDTLIRYNNDGKIQIKCSKTSNSTIHIVDSLIYKMGGGYQ